MVGEIALLAIMFAMLGYIIYADIRDDIRSTRRRKR